jgi:hypothetical protein
VGCDRNCAVLLNGKVGLAANPQFELVGVEGVDIDDKNMVVGGVEFVVHDVPTRTPVRKIDHKGLPIARRKGAAIGVFLV